MMRVDLPPRACEDVTQSEAADAADHRKLLQAKAIAIENDLRSTLRNFGLKVGMVGNVKFEGRIKELVENLPDLAIWWSPSSLSGGYFMSSLASCTAACWTLCGTMRCAGA